MNRTVSVETFDPLPLVSEADGRSKSGFTYIELRNYSYVLWFLVFIGFFCHIFVIFILVCQQVKRYFAKKLQNKEKKMHFKKAKMQLFRNQLTHINQININPTNEEENNDKSFNNNSLIDNVLINTERNPTSKECKLKTSKDYSNYVTYAFVFHQTIVDLLRILYALLYANRIYSEYKMNYQQNLDSSDLNSILNSFYEKNCTPMASFYSVLTMVTIVNILTILISETCRYYDLKFNTSDTSNIFCVLFGIMLIWISSLIIISSLMLVGIVESASPTWYCDLGEAESTTRSLVINITWFLLVAFILIIAFSYSISLYKELSILIDDNADKNESFLSTLASRSNSSLENEITNRHNWIVNETIKRLFILSLLIVVFVATFLPNFITTLLKNILKASPFSLNPYNLISCIINLSNSTFNSFILLFLCIKSKNTYLKNNFDNLNNYVSHSQTAANKSNMKTRLNMIMQAILRPFQKKYESDNICSHIKIDDSIKKNQISMSSLLKCNDECIQLNVITNCSSIINEQQIHSNNSQKNLNNTSINPNKNNHILVGSISPTNVKDFYSKIGNRLGNP